MNPLQKALKRTSSSVQRRWSTLLLAAALGSILALILDPHPWSFLAGGLLGAALAVLMICSRKFPQHYRRALRDL